MSFYAKLWVKSQPRQRLLAAAVKIDFKLEVIWQAVTWRGWIESEPPWRDRVKPLIITPLIFNPTPYQGSKH